jgi:putative SOS response-associated peptidase YedK
VRTKGAYRPLLERRRALIVADGFYEWRTDPDGRKRPIHYTLADGEPFAFAGLWASWRDHEADVWLDSCTIITTTANDLVAHVHDRMPVILPRAAEADWLDPELEADAVDALLVPYPASGMHAAEASTLVNSAKNDGPELLDPLA